MYESAQRDGPTQAGRTDPRREGSSLAQFGVPGGHGHDGEGGSGGGDSGHEERPKYQWSHIIP